MLIEATSILLLSGRLAPKDDRQMFSLLSASDSACTDSKLLDLVEKGMLRAFIE